MTIHRNLVAVTISCLSIALDAAGSPEIVGHGLKAWVPHAPPSDVSSLVLTSSDVKSSPAIIAAQGSSDPMAMSDGSLVEPSITTPAGWETTFVQGIMESKPFVDGDDKVGSWTSDAESGGTVPARMLKAEEFLRIGMEEAPADRWKEKAAENALRIYYHAKWLAERNYARAAEHRYRKAADLARKCRRSVLASHSLSRLGYFLVQWNRDDEAAEVLKESLNLNLKSNPVAPFLHGVLERKNAGSDVERLRAAEEYILQAPEQPSEELEFERQHLIDEISFWRQAETSSKHCFASADSAYMVICFLGHAVLSLRRFFGY